MMNTLGQRITNRGFIGKSIVLRLQSTTNNVTSNSTSSDIQIPIKIKRGPTDILRALERTINRDPTAPRYKYHDDPYLIPLSNSSKRSFALAQESGRKAAMWIREQHSDLFQHRVADPIIEKFLPKAVYTDKDDVNEDILKNVIADGHVTDALTIYKLINEDVTIDTKQSLFELLCYYNNVQPLTDDLLDLKWFTRVDNNFTWKNCTDTEKLFAYLKEQGTIIANNSYNTMICAMVKYLQIDRAWELYDETQKKNIPLYLMTYNQLIYSITNVTNGSSERRQLLIKLLGKMKESGIQPNTGTLNSSLKIASMIFEPQLAQDLCRSIFTEFKHAGVKPSLASYYYALRIFYSKNKSNRSSLLNEILNDIEGKEFQICDRIDTNFFVYAMDIASNILENTVISDRIHKLLLTGNNYDFLDEGHKENIYYRHYLTVQVKNQTIDDFMKNYYDLIVPNMYTPEPTVMDAIILAVGANDPEISTPLLPRLWTHIVQFNLLERKILVAKTLNLMRIQCKPPADSPINKMFANAAWTVWEFVMNERVKRIQTINWSGPILADIAILLLRADEFEKCNLILSYFYNEQNSIVEVPQILQIEELLDGCILRGSPDPAVDFIHYCSNSGIGDIPKMAQRLWSNVPLNESQENRLKSLVGPNVLKHHSSEKIS